LPPDWITINRSDGSISSSNVSNLSMNYSFDAMRIPWRIALDYTWNHNAEAINYLKSLNYLKVVYDNQGKIPIGFTHEGLPLQDAENPAMYATALAYFMVVDPQKAQKIYDQKILQLYSNDTNSFRDVLPYYEENWLWFGSALYLHYLAPLT
jgi:endoglucanase